MGNEIVKKTVAQFNADGVVIGVFNDKPLGFFEDKDGRFVETTEIIYPEMVWQEDNSFIYSEKRPMKSLNIMQHK